MGVSGPRSNGCGAPQATNFCSVSGRPSSVTAFSEETSRNLAGTSALLIGQIWCLVGFLLKLVHVDMVGAPKRAVANNFVLRLSKANPLGLTARASFLSTSSRPNEFHTTLNLERPLS